MILPVLILTDFVGLNLKDQLNKDLAKAKFFSVLSAGSTDSLITKNKIVHCLYFDPSPIGSDSVEVKFSYLSLKFLKDISSDGIHTVISDSIQKKLSRLEFLSASLLTEVKMTVSKQNKVQKKLKQLREMHEIYK